MSVKMRKHTERAQRVDLFMDGGAEDFPAGSKGGALAASLKEALSNLNALAVARSAGTSKRQQGTAGRRGARETLRELVEAVAHTAKSAARERPDIKGVFDLAGKDRSDQTLVATARAFADAAAPLAGLFAEYGLPATLANELRAGADGLEQNISLQTEATSAGASTTASAEETYQSLSDLIDRLDPIVRNKYRDNPVRLNAWERARRLESASHGKGKDHGNNNDTPTPPPTPPDNG
jgi:hypothetical protein